jgi:sugar phosphate isomerase/epimerase
LSILDRLSVQLYSARKFPPLDSQLATLARLGYANVEPYGGLLEEAQTLKAGVQRHKLKVPSTHVGLARLKDDLDGFVRQARELGVKLAIVPYLPAEERPNDAAGWRAFGRELGAIADRLAKHGLDLAWHNHDFEFRKLPEGAYPLDLILAAAPNLKWQADIGWIHAAGEDPAPWLKKHLDRIAAFHIKDAAPKGEQADEDGWTDVGAGVIEWRRLLPDIRSSAALLVIEHDNPKDFERFARNSRAAMAAW